MNKITYNDFYIESKYGLDSDTELLIEEEVETKTDKGWHIILWNDEVNTFEHVMDCLIEYCGHNMEQAEQCATIVHYNGKCSVKVGSKDKLKPIKEALQENELTVSLEKKV